MDWNDAKKAFAARVPVLYYPAPNQPPIRCEVAEVTLKRDKQGNLVHAVGCLDSSKNHIYHARPEQVEFAEV